MVEFISYPKIPRFNRTVIISEKIDGTNAQIVVEPYIADTNRPNKIGEIIDDGLLGGVRISVGSRHRYLTQENDNFGFYKWVADNYIALATSLGFGRHYGEWWGKGIQRGYDLKERKFSLFNVERWKKEDLHHPQLDVAPVIAIGNLSDELIDEALNLLRHFGSRVALGYMKPEGIIIYHKPSRMLFKKTFDVGKVEEDG